MARRATAIVVSVGLSILVSTGKAAASTVTVPGDFPTLQAVADWQVQQNVILDTVLVLPEVPCEPATFWHHGPLVLAGQPGPAGELPRIGRLELFDTADMRVQSLHIDGPVRYAWADYVFQHCVIESTVVWLGESDPGSIAVLSCTLNGNPAIDAMQGVVVDSSQVNGTIEISAHADASLGCYRSMFNGPGDWAIRASVSAPSEVAGNTIRGFTNGIFAQNDGFQFAVRSNLIEDCPGTAIRAYVDGGLGEIDRNVVRRCGLGIEVIGGAQVRDNRVVDCTGEGLHVEAEWVGVARNVVARCGGNGFWLALQVYGEIEARNNTSHGNAGNGFVLYGSFPFTHNIAHANQGHGVTADSLRPPLSGCNDWFANQAGDVRGFAPAGSDLSVDPRFCAVAQDDFQLMADSPLANAEGCTLIGALGVGCGSTRVPDAPTASTSWLRASPNPSRGPVSIEFSLGRQGRVELEVFDLQGRRVASLAPGVLAAGTHVMQWAGLGPRGSSPSGLYVLRLRHPDGDRYLRLIHTR